MLTPEDREFFATVLSRKAPRKLAVVNPGTSKSCAAGAWTRVAIRNDGRAFLTVSNLDALNDGYIAVGQAPASAAAAGIPINAHGGVAIIGPATDIPTIDAIYVYSASTIIVGLIELNYA